MLDIFHCLSYFQKFKDKHNICSIERPSSYRAVSTDQLCYYKKKHNVVLYKTEVAIFSELKLKPKINNI